jgi:hypothetical protein
MTSFNGTLMETYSKIIVITIIFIIIIHNSNLVLTLCKISQDVEITIFIRLLNDLRMKYLYERLEGQHHLIIIVIDVIIIINAYSHSDLLVLMNVLGIKFL